MAPSTHAPPQRLKRLNTVAPSLMQPSQNLGSRTPMQLVHISNSKLNDQIFSSRSLSIQRRILIKNFLAALYQLHPIEWIEDSPVDDKDHWMEQTLSAVGIGHPDEQQQEYGHEYDYYNQNYGYSSSDEHNNLNNLGELDESELSPAAAAAASAVSSRRRLRSLRSISTPLPRPVSMELPMALQSYLSTVFDVGWSVDLASKEDSLFTSKSAQHSSSRSSPTSSSLSSNSSSIDYSNSRHPQLKLNGRPGRINVTYGSEEYNKRDNEVSSLDFPAIPQTQIHGNRTSTTPANSNGVPQLQIQHENRPSPGMQSSSTNRFSAPVTSSRQDMLGNNQNNIHNHIHIHIHNYPPGSLQNDSHNGDREHHLPVVRSPRYPKSEPIKVRPASCSPAYFPPEDHAKSQSYSSYTLEFPAPPSKLPHSAPISIAVAGPVAPSTSPSSSPSLSAVYPPEKATYSLNSQEEQPYLATAPSTSRYSRSPPPPPYTQSPEEGLGSCYGSESNHRTSNSTSAPIPFYTSVLTTTPQSQSSLADTFSKASDSANQKLIEYQRYQERQKMFVRDDEGKNESRSTDGLGFIRQLFRSNSISGSNSGTSKKKSAGFVISAPLPTSTVSSPMMIASHTPYLLQDLTSQELVNQLPSRGSGSNIMD
ncbi:hypothetical protein BGZ49_001211 [Haplosporangium sp. Z 27]|nr:hypothetical protein BGZ49_001211 [Haplosporangium sp. Z 27]